MILKVEELKVLSSIILPAVESTEISSLPETLELVAENGILNFNITNKEYFLKVKMKMDSNEKLIATVNATLFLKLISQTTTDIIELKVSDTSLMIKGNGNYTIPLIFEGDNLLKLPVIEISKIEQSFDIEGDLLFSILKYNTKQLSTGILSRPVQKLYYMDEKGAITFTSGACVNSFTLVEPVKVLFNQRLVKLFKLFKGLKINFTVGSNQISDQIIQQMVEFKTDFITLTAIISSNNDMINSFPVDAIRSRAYYDYPYSISVNTTQLENAINRMKLFIDNSKFLTPLIKLRFNDDNLILSDIDDKNLEQVSYSSSANSSSISYTSILDLNELCAVLDSCPESDIMILFGDSQAIVINRLSIRSIIPEVEQD